MQTPVALTLLLISMTFLAAWLRSYVSVRFFQVSLVDNWFCILPLVPVPRVLAEILLGLQRYPSPLPPDDSWAMHAHLASVRKPWTLLLAASPTSGLTLARLYPPHSRKLTPPSSEARALTFCIAQAAVSAHCRQT